MAGYSATARLERAPVRIRSAPDDPPWAADPEREPMVDEGRLTLDAIRERLADLRTSFGQTTFFLLDSESWR
jgi:hypothetical protein